LLEQLQHALTTDDVLNEAWTGVILVVTHHTKVATNAKTQISSTEVQSLLEQYPSAKVIVDQSVQLNQTQVLLPGRMVPAQIKSHPNITIALMGPFLATACSDSIIDLFPVYRQYPDTYRCFAYGMYKQSIQPPSKNGAIYKLYRKIDSDGNLLIPVSSRLYSEGQSLSGRRLGIKGKLHSLPASALTSRPV
jgi:hypothetical protein